VAERWQLKLRSVALAQSCRAERNRRQFINSATTRFKFLFRQSQCVCISVIVILRSIGLMEETFSNFFV
jgi:hypothetical protein